MFDALIDFYSVYGEYKVLHLLWFWADRNQKVEAQSPGLPTDFEIGYEKAQQRLHKAAG
jgi:hypothetical protein